MRRKLLVWSLVWVFSISISVIFLEVSSIWGQSGSASQAVRYMPGKLVINFKPGIKPQSLNTTKSGTVTTGLATFDQLNATYQVHRMKKLFPGEKTPPPGSNLIDLSGYYIIEFPKNQDLNVITDAYANDPNIKTAEADAICPLYGTPNDEYLSFQKYIERTNDCDLDMFDAWDIEQGDSSIILAIVDSGVLYSHLDLGGYYPWTNANIWTNWVEKNGDTGVDDDSNGYIDDVRGWDWVDVGDGWPGEDVTVPDNDPKDFRGHGTHVAGTAAARTNNGTGVAGIAGGWYEDIPEIIGCRIMCLRFGWSDSLWVDPPGVWVEKGFGSMTYAAQAFNYARNKGACVINFSWGSSYNSALHDAAVNALNEGIAIIAAAGNDDAIHADYLNTIDGVINVAATDGSDCKADFSNYGGFIDVCAPGVGIYNTTSDHYTQSYTSMDGTSMAAPMVTGLVGLVRSKWPSLTGREAADLIIANTDDIYSLPCNQPYLNMLGTGRVNGYKVISAVLGVCGDVNDDGAPDFTDILYLIDYVFRGGPQPQCNPITACGDVNDDTGVDYTDILYLIDYIFRGGPVPIGYPGPCG